ncbi:MAG: HAD-IIIA family hydrolase [Eubacteriales bacterium]|nr:HAD-IIIA family hydrolase [Eubacteriales bacterium]
MGKGLFPDEYLPSAYSIDYERLYREGCRGVIYDVDNTLVPHGAPADERAVALFHRLHALGYRIMLLSNNREPRVKMFCDAVEGADYIYKAGKPGVRGYLRAMEEMGTDRDSTIFVGDQIFTDIWGANRAGLRSYMVRYIDPREEIQIVLKRIPERVILAAYFFYNKWRKRRGTLPRSVRRKESER